MSVATGSYRAGFFDYVVVSGPNSRAGTIMTVWNGSSIQYTDNSTLDIGSSSDVTMSADLSSTSVRVNATTALYTWNIKGVYRMI